MEKLYKNNIFDKPEMDLKEKFSNLFQKPTEQLFYNMQYNSISILIGIIVGTVIDYCFPHFSPKYLHVMLLEIMVQTILISIAVYYIPKLSKLVPFLGNKNFNFSSHDYTLILSLVFVSSQINYLKKIQFVSKYLKKKLSNLRNGASEYFTPRISKKEEAKKIIKQFMKENPGVITINSTRSSNNIPIDRSVPQIPIPQNPIPQNSQPPIELENISNIMPNNSGQLKNGTFINKNISSDLEFPMASNESSGNLQSNLNNMDYNEILKSINNKT